MATRVIFEEQVEVPLNIGSLDDFRRWALSDDFPERGRIDYLNGRIEVDISPEDFFCHGTLKTEMIVAIGRRVKHFRLGHVASDRTRVSSVAGELSAEPDLVFISHGALQSGGARLVPKATGERGRFVEVDGAPDLVVEIVSDGSVVKDTQRLPAAYFEAGVREFWLADARGEEMLFRIHRRGAERFEPAQTAADGYQRSEVLGCWYLLNRSRDQLGYWMYDLDERE